MNKYVLTAMLCPLFGSAVQAPSGEPTKRPGEGGYEACPVDAALAVEGKAFIQENLPALTILEVREAYTQLAAGFIVKLVCKVAGEDGPALWQFEAFRSLDWQWHFQGANRL